MANVKLYHEEVVDNLLPHVCMLCGRRSVLFQRKTFAWYPPFASLIPFLPILLRQRMTVNVPLCSRHRHHWRWRTLVILLGSGMLLGGGCLYYFLTANQPRPMQSPEDQTIDDLSTFVCLAGIGCGWLLAVFLLQYSAIRATEITARRIILTGVARNFCLALQDEREEDRRAHRNSRDRRIREK